MKDNYLDFFEDKDKAIDHALWLNFKYRIANITFGVIAGPDNNWAVLEEATSKEMEMPFLNVLPNDYSKMSYRNLRHIKMDSNPLPHFEELFGAFSTMDGELLRFILQTKIPLEKIIRHELASRGFDKNHRWCGFDKAQKIWLK
ncbi:hypothetical protein KCTC32516_00562 [Polaribacter huanghezhanensis]|uniref:hypothetical protein n=1 Tax=Polaribacter huanghezhanensis TaxID=1354726 RepID=UPI002649257B|nr:hypothetical protein [Polaribacter huanghezhanensis]WKD85222.1 hypothetical protein KCTC32516_00562 [Polaribacter huanghezhanensis]